MDDDDLDWEEWMEMSDAQHDAILERTMREYSQWLDRLTLKQRVAHHRKNALRGCLTWRKLMREHGLDFAVTYLRERQISLLKLRQWRLTGVYPGSA